MAEANLEIAVSVEAALHTALADLAIDMKSKYGIELHSVVFDWAHYTSVGPGKIGVQITSRTLLACTSAS